MLLFDPPAPTLAPTSVPDLLFPVRRVICVGRNYAAHAREMGSDPDREPPFFFTKWAETVVPSGAQLAYPPGTQDFQFEAELVIAIGKGGRNIEAADALAHVYGYAVGIDMTRRDTQAKAKKAGGPWDHAKAFDQSAPIGPVYAAAKVGHPEKGRIWLSVNGVSRQSSDIANMIFSVSEIIAAVSRGWELAPGDLIFTGTPDGVGPVVSADVITGGVDGLGEIRFEMGPPAR